MRAYFRHLTLAWPWKFRPIRLCTWRKRESLLQARCRFPKSILFCLGSARSAAEWSCRWRSAGSRRPDTRRVGSTAEATEGHLFLLEGISLRLPAHCLRRSYWRRGDSTTNSVGKCSALGRKSSARMGPTESFGATSRGKRSWRRTPEWTYGDIDKQTAIWIIRKVAFRTVHRPINVAFVICVIVRVASKLVRRASRSQRSFPTLPAAAIIACSRFILLSVHIRTVAALSTYLRYLYIIAFQKIDTVNLCFSFISANCVEMR